MKNMMVLIILAIANNPLFAQLKFSTVLKNGIDDIRPIQFQNEVNVVHNIKIPLPQSNSNSQTSIWVEIGYVLAMETFFTGMSYLASRKNRWGPSIVGGLDLFFVAAGFNNALMKEMSIQQVGHSLLLVGFLAKALYNFHFFKNHNTKERFLTNFIGYNVLVFTGYYLDTLD